MTTEEIIAGVIAREGQEYTNHPADKGGPTRFGITLATLRAYHQNNSLTAQDVMELDEVHAALIYHQKFVVDPGFTQQNVPYEPLRVQLIDFGVNSGPERAVRWLQRVLRIDADGVLGPATRGKLRYYHLDVDHGLALVNDTLVAARSYMIDTATDHGTVSKPFEEGLESRALSFFLARP